MNIISREQFFSKQNVTFWFCLSLLIPVYYCTITLLNVFSYEYIVQDDARLHIVWLQRFVDSELFPNDWIADYYMAYASPGFKSLYWLGAQVNLEPMFVAKLLPIPVGLVATAYIFGVSYQIFPLPAGAFLTTLIFNQGMWFKNDVLSATARGFAYPFFAGFLFYLLKGRVIPCLFFIGLQAFFYPMICLVSVGILIIRLIQLHKGSLQLSRQKINYVLVAGGLIIVAVILSPAFFRVTEFEPQVTAAQMKEMVEFSPNGRSPYFGFSPLLFWTHGRSGVRLPLLPPVAWLALLLPWLRKSQKGLIKHLTPKIEILWQILLPSLGLFVLAHIMLLRLYLPSRYTYFSFRFILPIAGGIVLTVLFEKTWRWFDSVRRSGRWLSPRQFVTAGLAAFFAFAFIFVPLVPPVLTSNQHWFIGKRAELYEFIAEQPKDTVVASLSRYADNIPSFSERSVLVSRESAIAFHLGYYEEIRKRVVDIMAAQYSPTLEPVKQLIQTYDVDFLLVDKGAFTPEYISENEWLMQFQPAAEDAIATLKQAPQPAVEKLSEQCSAFTGLKYILLDAQCIKDSARDTQ